MKKILQYLAISLLALSFVSAASDNQITIYAVGDSSMADYDVNTYPNQRGWAQMFRQFLTGDISLVNAARNGRSSKSFYNEGLWNNVVKEVKSGDYVFIQFGHNDEKDGGVSGSGGIGTDPWGEYKEYLTKYVTETRGKGGVPILITPIVRCYFSGNVITNTGVHNLSATEDSLLNYPRAMKAVARELNVPLIDHTTLTKELVEEYGQAKAKSIIYVESDNSHLSVTGATLVARLAVQALINQNIMTTYLNASPDIIINPTDVDFGNCYVSSHIEKTFTLSGMSLSPSDGSVTISASDGFSVSLTKDGVFENNLKIDYTQGNISLTNIYVRFSPTESKQYLGSITVSSSAEPNVINLRGNALPLIGGIPASVNYPLIADAQGEVTGPIVSLGQSWNGMYAKNYATPSGTTTWPEGVTGGKAQRNLIEGDTWPGNEIDIVTSRYVQFAVKAQDNTTFTIDSIGVYAGAAGGNGMGYRVMMSTDASFNTATILEDRPTNVSNTMLALSYSPIFQVNGGETFYLRFYPWYSSSATSKYLCLQNLTISGQVTTSDVGITDSFEKTNIKVYPNPSDGIFYIDNLSSQSNLTLCNSMGVKIKEFLHAGNFVDLSGYPEGIYLLNITEEGKQETVKLLKK